MLRKLKPYIIAEIASAHQGNYKNIIKLANFALKSNADFVKLQIFDLYQLIDTKHKAFKIYEKICIKPSDWEKAIIRLLQNKINLIIEPYDINSLKIASKFKKIKNYKIPASSINNRQLVKQTLKLSSTLFIGVGGSNIDEISNVLKIAKNYPNTKIVLVCGFQNFPTKIEDSNLWQIQFLKNKFNVEICYADHMDSSKIDEAVAIPVIAFMLGAAYIEKHITFNRDEKGFDYYSSLEPNEFSNLAKLLKQINKLSKSKKKWELSKKEKSYRSFSKKFGLIKNNLPKNHKIKKADFLFVRTSNSTLTEEKVKNLIGKVTRKKLIAGSAIKENFLQDEK